MNLQECINKVNELNNNMEQIIIKLEQMREEKTLLVTQIDKHIMQQPCKYCNKPSKIVVITVFYCLSCYQNS